MAVSDVYEVQLHWQIGSQPTMNVFHLVESQEETNNNPALGVVDAVHTRLMGTIQDVISDDATIIGAYVRRVHPSPGIPIQVVFGGAEFAVITGAIASEPLPSSAPAVVTFYSETFSGRGRGRMYIPGVPESHQKDGQFTLAAFGLWDAAAQALLPDWVPAIPFTGEWQLTVWSRSDTASHVVRSIVMRTNIAVMRSRRANVGFGS